MKPCPVLVLWLLLVLPQSHSQHWSYGLSPGGKRGLDDCLDQHINVPNGFLQLDKPCRVLACGALSALATICRLKGLHGDVADRKTERRTFKII
ncbi:progonadoliberin-1-like [Entelurus aequoreus]|uniref:progonadoliberin-1-like n=1 Tax=Entelurus aequoreus TaxID=161455 RepID=UPI002B1D2841|nr:progonadoliberin-1-like [Entelurus aequoreus]XP_061907707.1 progonadoliberin-1-like [Entelurus aequoreus]XP_061907708.1 progonadoliberin-1-like [Entelurus aequoreus]XP_061907709.1 progonadoliberin-1-like [Entelurus aequoreus]